jgi:hypothetical protein
MEKQEPLLLAFRSRLIWVIFVFTLFSFLILSTFLVHYFKDIFNSPDELANFYFIKQFKEQNNFFLPSPSREELPSFVHPRSMLRIGSFLIPVGFVSFPLFLGLIAKILGLKLLPYFIVFISFLAILAWFGFLKFIFGKQIALLSSFVLLLHPAYFALSLRPFSPNLFFVNCLIFAAYFFSKTLTLQRVKLPSEDQPVNIELPLTAQPQSKRRIFSFLFGLFFGLALALRPSEIVWLLFSIFLIFFFLRKDLKAFSYLFACLGLALPLGLLFWFQRFTYGHILATGYTMQLFQTEDLFSLILSLGKKILFPFGFNLRQSWQVVFSYFVNLMWWFALPCFLGIVSLLFKPAVMPQGFRKKISFWLLFFTLIFLWLALFYGPWEIKDRLDNKIGLGVSYVRYFLPLYLLSIPLISLGIWRLIRFFRFERKVSFVLIMVLIFLSLRLVWWGTDESILSLFQTLKTYEKVRNEVLFFLPSSAIILTERSDKIFFPHYEVISAFKDREILVGLKSFTQEDRLWFDDEAINKEKVNFWQKNGFSLEKVKSLEGGYSLYKVKMLYEYE